MTEAAFFKNKRTRAFLIAALLVYTIAPLEGAWLIGNFFSGLLLLAAIVICIKGGKAPGKLHRPLCAAYAALMVFEMGWVIYSYLMSGKSILSDMLISLCLLLTNGLAAVQFLLFCTKGEEAFQRVKQFLTRYGKRTVAGLYAAYLVLYWSQLLAIFTHYIGMSTLTQKMEERLAFGFVGLWLVNLISVGTRWGLQHWLIKELAGEKPKKRERIFVKWRRRLCEEAEREQKAAMETAELAWCGDGYDPVADHDPEGWPFLEEHAIPGREGRLFADEEERAFFEQYRRGEPLPEKEWEWQWKNEGGPFDWESQLANAPVYTFLKGEAKVQALFEKTLKSAREELEDFPPQGSYRTKAVKRFLHDENEFTLRAVLTGRPGRVEEADFYFCCREA